MRVSGMFKLTGIRMNHRRFPCANHHACQQKAEFLLDDPGDELTWWPLCRGCLRDLIDSLTSLLEER